MPIDTPFPVSTPKRQAQFLHPDTGKPIWLTPRQGEIFFSRARFLVHVAGRRSGKTILALFWLCHEIMTRPQGAIGYYLAPTRIMAKQIAWKILKRMTKEFQVSVQETELTIELPGNRQITLRGTEDPERLEGVSLSAVVLDEWAKQEERVWTRSIRPALADKLGRAMFVGKPRGTNHLKTYYERGQPTDPSYDPEWASWLTTTQEGGFVDIKEITDAAKGDPRDFRQEYLATFETSAGRVYDSWQRSRAGKPWHVAPHSQLEAQFKNNGGRWQFKRIVIGVDWGLTNPGVMLTVGYTGTGRCVVLHEEYHTGILVSEAGWLGIGIKLRDEYRPDTFLADPSEPGNIKALRLALGATIVLNANNEVAEGIRRVSIKLLEREDKLPGLIISDSCQNLIREIEGYVWREVQGAAAEEPVKSKDHAVDALRYAVAELARYDKG